MKKLGLALSLVIGIFLLSGLASAGFEVDGNGTFITKQYSSGDFVRGEVRMSFSNIGGETAFESNFDGGKKLIDLLEDMGYTQGIEFSCTPSGCESDYSTGLDAGSTHVEFNLDRKRTYGFKLIGKEVKVADFDFRIFSGAPTSCKNQIFVDFFDDGTIDFFNTHYDESIACGERDFGCFDEGGTFIDAGFGGKNQFYCERITLPIAPAYRIGAKISGEGDTPLTLLITDPTGKKRICDQHKAEAIPVGGEVSVVIPCGFTEEFEALVCISDEDGNGDNYRIRAEQDADDACGGFSTGNLVVYDDFDYEIFAQPLAYDEFGWLNAKDYSDPNSEDNLPKVTDTYIKEVYNRDCEEGCYVPISFWRGDNTDLGLDQVIILETNGDQLLKYTADNLVGLRGDKLFELFEGSFMIDSNNFTTLDVEKMEFVVPREEGSKEFVLELGDEEVTEEQLDIEVSFEFSVTPKFSLIGKQTVFSVSSAENISSSEWNFGDGNPVVNSEDGRASNTYYEGGEYFLEVEVKSNAGTTSSKRIKILVGEPETSANTLLQEYAARVDNLEDKLDDFPKWIRDAVEAELGLVDIEGQVTSIGNALETANTEEEFIKIIDDFLELDIPQSLFVKESGTIPGGFGFGNIDPGLIAEISGDSITNAEEVKAGILDWMGRNYDFDIEFETIVKTTDLTERVVLRSYLIDIERKGGAGDDFVYLIIDHPATSVRFRDSSDTGETLGGEAYVKINSLGEPDIVEFLIASGVPPSADGLGIYISPVLSDLNVVDKKYGGIFRPSVEFKLGRFLIATVLLLLVFLVIYVSLQIWYKKYYEKHLFKNPNHLYNLVNFIYNSRKARLGDKEIGARLRKQNWNKGQIAYTFKKIDGKRTGMWEIPIFKFVENRKVKKEIEKRQGKPLDARFIKRPVVY